MKPKAIFFGILLSIIFAFMSCAQKADIPVLKGPFLGQKPPGMTPEIFAPGTPGNIFYQADAAWKE